MNVVWHGHYVRYMELARCALLERYRYGYSEMLASGYAWPVVDMRIKYLRTVSFRQRLRVHATVAEWENRLRIDYLMLDAVSGARINKAHTIQVAVDLKNGEMQFACPPILRERLGVGP